MPSEKTKKWGIAGVGVAIAALVLGLVVRSGSPGPVNKAETTSPTLTIPARPPTVRVVKNEVRIDPARFGLNVPEGWAVAQDGPKEKGVTTIRSSEGFTVTTAAGMRGPGSNPDAGGDAQQTLNDLAAEKKKQYGNTENVEFTREMLGGYRAPALVYTFYADGGATRAKTWMVVTDQYWMSFTCTAKAEAFVDAETACRGVVDSLHSQP